MHCILHSLSMLRLCDIRTTGHSKEKPSGPDAGLCKPGSLLFNCFTSGDSYIFSLASGQVWVITAKESSSTLSSSQDRSCASLVRHLPGLATHGGASAHHVCARDRSPDLVLGSECTLWAPRGIPAEVALRAVTRARTGPATGVRLPSSAALPSSSGSPCPGCSSLYHPGC